MSTASFEDEDPVANLQEEENISDDVSHFGHDSAFCFGQQVEQEYSIRNLVSKQ